MVHVSKQIDNFMQHFQEVVLIYVWPVETSVSLANSPYFPLSGIIPFVRLTTLYRPITIQGLLYISNTLN